MSQIPDILRKIREVKEQDVQELKSEHAEELQRAAGKQTPPRKFREALTASDKLALIAEIKKGSPSEGIIREDFDPPAIARGYAEGGGRCLSVLTDAPFFCGHLEHLKKARQAVDLPALRKDFILDEIQVTEARAWGADCILIIMAMVEPRRATRLLSAARDWDMDALVEVHDRRELGLALEMEPEMIGVNSRDLRTFEVNLETAQRLAEDIPKDITKVAESGISSRSDALRVKSWGFDAILVGTHLMRQDDPQSAAADLSEV